MNDYNILVLFGLNVKKYRHNKRISQEELGFLSELHRTYISDVEKGVRNISLKNIQKIANALDVDLVDLFDFNDLNIDK